MKSILSVVDEDTSAPDRPAFTLATLFDDVIDAEHMLSQLRRSNQPPATISVILREQVLRDDDDTSTVGAVVPQN